jgi:hypothetical protein
MQYFLGGDFRIKTCEAMQNVYAKHWWWKTCGYFLILIFSCQNFQKQIALKSKFQNKIIIQQQDAKPKKVL